MMTRKFRLALAATLLALAAVSTVDSASAIQAPLHAGDQVLITFEPGGGSGQPTSKQIPAVSVGP